jgi:Class II flagellar assembly regulator
MAAIEGVGPTRATRIGAKGPARASSGFTVPDETAVSSHAAAEAAPAAGLASMLTLQEAGGDAAEDREARRHGQDLLAALAELQRALLIGNDDAAALEQLAELAASVPPRASDRRLAEVVSAITVRVQVELARRHL